MRVFVTGATGFVGSAVVEELLGAGHQVVGLARNESNAKALTEAGAGVHRGDLEDLASLRSGADGSDAAIHCGFIHDFSRYAEVCAIDGKAIEAIGDALAGSDRPFLVTSGTAALTRGRAATEEDQRVAVSGYPRVSEEGAVAAAARGVRASVIRLSPSVYGDGDFGFIAMLIKLAREKGASAYIGDGLNRWTAVHRLDAARLYRLALEKGAVGARYHGVDEEGVTLREIAEVIGRRLNLPVVSRSPEEAAEHFGWFAGFVGLDCPATSVLTRERLGWRPTRLGLLADLESSEHYFKG